MKVVCLLYGMLGQQRHDTCELHLLSLSGTVTADRKKSQHQAFDFHSRNPKVTRRKVRAF